MAKQPTVSLGAPPDSQPGHWTLEGTHDLSMGGGYFGKCIDKRMLLAYVRL